MLRKLLGSSSVILRRRRYLINPKFQIKYLIIVLVLVIVILLSTAYYVNLTLRTTTLLENLSGLEVEAVTKLVFRTVVYVCIIFVVLIVTLGIFVLHRIAGPLYVFDKMFNLLSDGDLTIYLKLRKGDELQELAASFQNMVDKLRMYVKSDKEKVEKIKFELQQLVNNYNKLSQQELLEKLNKIRDMLSELYKNFKTDV
ncbi:MAG: methyl-accepting chemotaxis protein [Endomicrobia bacterium]|nr:methyl-accepting chemotaxis protein [Endomicrobiia bacterium]MDW8055666.1 methyl-accepting chemotaxis protein [Elusimicrobiota bacterium]